MLRWTRSDNVRKSESFHWLHFPLWTRKHTIKRDHVWPRRRARSWRRNVDRKKKKPHRNSNTFINTGDIRYIGESSWTTLYTSICTRIPSAVHYYTIMRCWAFGYPCAIWYSVMVSDRNLFTRINVVIISCYYTSSRHGGTAHQYNVYQFLIHTVWTCVCRWY